SATLSGGTANLTKIFTSGQHSLTAQYAGNGCLSASTSPGVTLNVTAVPTALQAGSTPNPSQAGQSVAMTAWVYAGGVLRTTATGTIQFLEGTTVLGTAPVSNGRATLNYSGLAAGVHSITASYGGDGTLGASSTSFSQTVTPCPSTTSLNLNVF